MSSTHICESCVVGHRSLHVIGRELSRLMGNVVGVIEMSVPDSKKAFFLHKEVDFPPFSNQLIQTHNEMFSYAEVT